MVPRNSSSSYQTVIYAWKEDLEEDEEMGENGRI